MKAINDKALRAMVKSSELGSDLFLLNHLTIMDLPDKARATLSRIGELYNTGKITENRYIFSGGRYLEKYFTMNPEERKKIEADITLSLRNINSISYAGVC
ncbi:MAG: hypothetical protein NT129_02090 [Candidatus Aenigmarchaeota archaeon]|nr:hypothetical protein [Candidatus Aenigmarchaeota archaeon]